MKSILVLVLLMLGCQGPQSAKVSTQAPASKPVIRTLKAFDFSASRIIEGEFVTNYKPTSYWRDHAIYEFKSADEYCESLRLGYSNTGELSEMTCKSPSMRKPFARYFMESFLKEVGSGRLKNGEAVQMEGVLGVDGRWNATDGFTFRMLSGSSSVKQTVRTWFKTLEIQRGFSMASISKAIEEKQRDITNCYKQALLRNPGFESKMTVEANVDAAGNVVKVSAGSVPEEKELSRCVGEHFYRMKFPKPIHENALIRKTFIFETAKKGQTR